MKKIVRMIIFSGASLYLTSLWNKGFILNLDLKSFLQACIIIAIVYYLIVPFSKLILLPLNILTMGLVSVALYFLIFYFIVTRLSIINISSWTFAGLNLGRFAIQKTNISFLANTIISSLSVSMIINLLEGLI